MSSQNNDGCCCMFLVVIICLSALSYLHHSTPIPTTVFPRLQINSVKVSDFNLSNPISAHWNMDMSLVNYYYNDISFGFYDNVISIFHGSRDEALWMTSLEKFAMNGKNPRVHFTLDFWGSSTKVDNSTVEGIRERIANNYGAVKFVVQFKARNPIIWFDHALWRFRYDSNIDELVASCEVQLLFGTPDKTRANMIRING